MFSYCEMDNVGVIITSFSLSKLMVWLSCWKKNSAYFSVGISGEFPWGGNKGDCEWLDSVAMFT